MRPSTLSTLTALLLPLLPHTVHGLGHALLINHCPYDLHVWDVDQTILTPTARILRGHGGVLLDSLRQPCEQCGVSYKFARRDAAGGDAAAAVPVPTNITQFEYGVVTQPAPRVYYDISLINCAVGEDASACPGHEAGLVLDGPEAGGMKGCVPFVCEPGAYCPEQAYYVPVPGVSQPVATCDEGSVEGVLRFNLCSSLGPAIKMPRRELEGSRPLDQAV